MSRRSSMSRRFAGVRVTTAKKTPSICKVNRITPLYDGQEHRSVYAANKSIRSTSELNSSSLFTNDSLVSTSIHSFQPKYKSKSNKMTNRDQTSIPNQSNFDNRQKLVARKKKLSCQQKSMLSALLFITFLMLITFILPYILIYFLSQKVTVLMEMTQTNSSEVNNYTYYCGGVTTSPAWTVYIYNSGTLSLVIDTSSCKFNSTPLYFTSSSGDGNHFGLASYTAIYGPSSTSFTIYITSLFGFNSTKLLSMASTYNWNINWLGLSY